MRDAAAYCAHRREDHRREERWGGMGAVRYRKTKERRTKERRTKGRFEASAIKSEV